MTSCCGEWDTCRAATIGDRCAPSPLGNIQPDHWLPEYATERLNVLNILGWLVEVEPQQAALLEKICSGPTISAEELRAAGAFEPPVELKRQTKREIKQKTTLKLPCMGA